MNDAIDDIEEEEAFGISDKLVSDVMEDNGDEAENKRAKTAVLARGHLS